MVNHAQFVTTLLSPYGEKNLTQTEVDGFRSAMQAVTEQHWLEEGVACDLYHDIPHVGLASDLPFDLISQPTAYRRKALLVADMDSTLIQQECIDELAAECGIKPQIAAITEKAMNGELEFETALCERVALLKDLPEQKLQYVYETRITLAPGAMTLAATMRAHGAYLVIVSGGFDFFTFRVRELLNFHEDRSNRLEMVDGKLSGNVLEPILGQQAKLDALVEIAAAKGIPREATLAIGDGANDVPMLQMAGLGVACHAKPHVQAKVEAKLNYNDLSSLLYAQGYRREEWVSE